MFLYTYIIKLLLCCCFLTDSWMVLGLLASFWEGNVSWLLCQERAVEEAEAGKLGERGQCLFDARGSCFSKHFVWHLAVLLENILSENVECLRLCFVRTFFSVKCWLDLKCVHRSELQLPEGHEGNLDGWIWWVLNLQPPFQLVQGCCSSFSKFWSGMGRDEWAESSSSAVVKLWTCCGWTFKNYLLWTSSFGNPG